MGVTNPRVFSPAGYQVTSDDTHVSINGTDTYTLIKLITPEIGTWKMRVSGVGEDDIHISYLKTYSMVVKQDFSAQHVPTNETLTLNASLQTSDGVLSDSDLIATLVGEAEYTKKGGESKKIALTNNGDGTFSCDVSIDTAGEYDFVTTISAANGSFSKVSRARTIYVDDVLSSGQTRIEQTISEEKVQAKTPVKVTSKLFNEATGDYVTNSDSLDPLLVKCSVFDGVQKMDFEMFPDADGSFSCTFTPELRGVYDVVTQIFKKDNEGELIKESFPSKLTVDKRIPTSKKPIDIVVRSNPSKTTDSFILSDYVVWDDTEEIQVSIEPTSSAYFTTKMIPSPEDAKFEITGVKAGKDSAVITVRDTSGDSCTVQLNVKVTSGWIPILEVIFGVVGVVAVLLILKKLVEPKLNNQVVRVLIHVSYDIAEMQPAEQDVATPKNANEITLYKALHSNVNTPAFRSFEKVIIAMNLNPVLKNIKIKADGKKRLSVVVSVRKGDSCFVNGTQIERTTKFSLGESSGECSIRCGDNGGSIVIRR